MKNNYKKFKWTKELIKQYLDNNNYQGLNMKDRYSDTGFIWACEHQPKLAEIMLEKDYIDFNLQDNFGNTGFMMACRYQPELMKQMLNNDKIDQTLEDQAGLTGYDLVKKHNLKSFEIYQSWLEQKNINNQVQKKMRKPSQHL